MSNVNITYETLYEILRNEKNREDIQELSPSFYEDVVTYLQKNQKMLNEALQKNASDEEKEDLVRQVKNIKNMIKEIYERREKKIITLALHKSRTNSASLEIDTILVQEKELYEKLVGLMNCLRKEILFRALDGKIPVANQNTCAMGSANTEPQESMEKKIEASVKEETSSTTENKEIGKKEFENGEPLVK